MILLYIQNVRLSVSFILDMFTVLTSLNPDMLIQQLQEEVVR